MNHFICSAILFDMDGVLVDSKKCTENIWKTWAKNNNLDPMKVLEVSHGRRTIEIIQIMAPHLDSIKESYLLEKLAESETDGILKIEGSSELFRNLNRQNYAIVTSSSIKMALTRLRHVRIPIPDIIIGSGEVKSGKPHPEGYLTAAKKLRIPKNNCLVLEDSPAGIEAAKRANIPVIGITNTFNENELNADVHITSLKDIIIEVSTNLIGKKEINVTIKTGYKN